MTSACVLPLGFGFISFLSSWLFHIRRHIHVTRTKGLTRRQWKINLSRAQPPWTDSCIYHLLDRNAWGDFCINHILIRRTLTCILNFWVHQFEGINAWAVVIAVRPTYMKRLCGSCKDVRLILSSCFYE